MDTIIGLGNAGCNIVDMFSKHFQYKTYKIDVGLVMNQNMYSLPKKQSIMDYENDCADLSDFFANVKGEVLFVVGGGGKVSASSLAILKQLSHCNLSILYIKPDLSFLGDEATAIHKMVFNVFQEYARSGVFDRLFLVDNAVVEEVIPDVSIKNYFDNLNEAIVSSLHMINVFNHIDSVTDTFYSPPVAARISTIGFVDPKKNADRLFFSLDSVTDMVYYYAYNKMKLETENKLFAEIKNSLKRKAVPGIRVSYGIFETDYDEDYIYCVSHTSIIQEQHKDGGSEDLPTSP